MNTQRAIIKGHIADLKPKKIELAGRIAANLRAVKNTLAASTVTSIEQLDIEGAAVHLSEAASLKAEYLETCGKIAALESELE
ncbi:hypothetical protein [Desulfatibacillum aliphaticivorans]|uniref:hypothetical protein n=1 Tax=Desulfatibacillum aliphaticivorans TaxID=218208 RepID=UPI00040CC49F|nr:hypothetical protein [Desulfatibacillum aliphaticivorans]